MLRIDNLKLPVGASEEELRAACAHALRVSAEALVSVRLLRRSIDAREGVRLVCAAAVEVRNEAGVLKRCKNKNVQPYAPKKYMPPAPVSAPAVSPVVIGAGPAGLFCALLLARCGARPILLERGRAVEQRKRDVDRFWRTGELDLTSNVQFGEGGAGAFSDGKLNTGTKDERHGFILEEFVRFGASEDILVDAKPHVGTDKLYVVLQNLRREILALGGEIRFSHRAVDILTEGGSVTALRVASPEGEYTLKARHVLEYQSSDPIVNALNGSILTTPDSKVKVIFVPTYLNKADGIFGKDYYELLVGMDMTVFPSYYEPWGYTPLESVAFSVPTITTTLAGFGLWAAKQREHAGVEIVLRDDYNDQEVEEKIAESLLHFSLLDDKHVNEMRVSAYEISETALWEHLFAAYEQAYSEAYF